VDHRDVGEAVDGQTWRAFCVAVEQTIRGQVRAVAQQR
jgi:hypothetical protein